MSRSTSGEVAGLIEMPHLGAGPAYGGYTAAYVHRRFVVEGHDVGARLDEARRVALGVGKHKMYVEHLGRCPAYGLHDRESERYVRYEHAVHHVDVYPLGRAAVDHLDIVSELSEVGRQNRRSYDTFHN